MTKEEFDAARATMPWTDHWALTANGKSGQLRILDRFNREVPFKTMCGVLVLLSRQIAKPADETPTTPMETTK